MSGEDLLRGLGQAARWVWQWRLLARMFLDQQGSASDRRPSQDRRLLARGTPRLDELGERRLAASWIEIAATGMVLDQRELSDLAHHLRRVRGRRRRVTGTEHERDWAEEPPEL